MFKRFFIAFIFISLSIFIFAEDTNTIPPNAKKGWSIGPLPALGFDSDRGFLLGVTGELYNFGDGKIFPKYYHKFKTEISFYTKGSANIQAYYDSKYLIKNTRTMFDVGYFPDKYYDFYGLNCFNPQLYNFDSKIFNKIDRNLLRFQADFQRKIYKNLNWAAGIGFQSYQLNRVQDNEYKNDTVLFDIYKLNNLLPLKELNGGTHLLFKLGLVYDTRDFEADPNSGICSEVIFAGSPDVIENNKNDFLQLTLTHRQFINIITNHLTLAYRIGYQKTIAGNTPFYMMQNVNTFFQKRLFNEGLGGNATIRGISRNRIVSDGEGWANIELRWKFARFKFIGQNWALALTPFADAGMIINDYSSNIFSNLVSYKNPEGELHSSIGAGLKVIMNQNFIISIDYGKAMQKTDGNSGFYILLNYMF